LLDTAGKTPVSRGLAALNGYRAAGGDEAGGIAAGGCAGVGVGAGGIGRTGFAVEDDAPVSFDATFVP
jgi:hypothetical protein